MVYISQDALYLSACQKLLLGGSFGQNVDLFGKIVDLLNKIELVKSWLF